MEDILLDKTIKCNGTGITLHWPCQCGAYAQACGSCDYISRFTGLIKEDGAKKLMYYGAVGYLDTYKKTADKFMNETQRWSTGGSLRWLIFDGHDVAPCNLAGTIEIIGDKTMKKKGVMEAAYWVAGRFSGRGIATTALAAVADNAFENGYKSIRLSIYKSNHASMRVAEKAGFVIQKSDEWLVWARKYKYAAVNR